MSFCKNVLHKPKVVVKAEAPKVANLTEVAQVSATKLTATLAIPVEKAEIADVKIIRDENNAVIAVKSVALDATDKTKLTIETYADLTDGKAYTVTYTAQTEDKTESSASFTATDGTIADFALSTTSITANKATEIKYTALDAKGVEIYTKTINDIPNGIDIVPTYDNGYMDGSKLVLLNAGDTAKIVITYHTYKYDTEGNEIDVIKKEFTVTAVEANATVSNFVYTVVGSNGDGIPNSVDFSTLTAPNTKISMSEKVGYVKFQIKDSNGEDVTTSCGYTVESSNSNILLATGEVANWATIRPVAEGSAYLILKDSSNKTITTLPITVVAKRTIASFALSKTSVSIATTAATASAGATFISYSVKDQYGDAISAKVTAECVSKPSKDADSDKISVDTVSTTGKILISSDSADKGSYTYKVKADVEGKTLTKTINVNVVSPSGDTGYALQFVGAADSVEGTNAITSMDSTVKGGSDAAKTISVNIVKKQSGVIVGAVDADAVTISSIKVVGSNGTTYVEAKGKAASVSTAAITKDVVEAAFASGMFNIKVTEEKDSVVVKNLPAGSYTVTVTLQDGSKKHTVVSNFTITDAQPVLTASVLKTTTDNSTLEAVVRNKDLMKYVYDGKSLDAATVKYVGKDAVDNGKTCVVRSVTIGVPVNDGKYVQMTVPVNRVFTTTADNWN